MNEDLAAAWKALADSTRRQILDLLKGGPRTTGEVCAHFRTSRFAVMKHLSVLERAGLVIVERQGRERWNYLNAVPLQRIYERWISGYAGLWAASLTRLTQHVETRGNQTGRARGGNQRS
jgi:DNA-binding transcriptional ArsR family regulator